MTLTDAPLVRIEPPGPYDSDDSTETALARVLAELLGVEHVSPQSHFFDDLGADSMVMTRFCARARRQPGLPSVSMRDIYRSPTISALVAALAAAPPTTGTPAEPGTGAPQPALTMAGASAAEAAISATSAASETSVSDPVEAVAPTGTPRYVLCGALQLLMVLVMSFVGALILARGYDWVSTGSGVIGTAVRAALPAVPARVGTALLGSGFLGVYLRAVLFTGVAFLIVCALPIVAKWVLIGRWKRQRIRVWSLAYVRFWVVKTLIRANPLVLFAGSPLYVMYLRALGAKIAPGVLILSRQVPVCTDLLTIGEDTVIRKDSALPCYRARAGVIETGPVTLGANVLVSEATVLDIDTSMGHWAQLGHASSLQTGQAVPHGEIWYGSPAQPGDMDFRDVSSAPCGVVRRFLYVTAQLMTLLVVSLPLGYSVLCGLVTAIPQLDALPRPGPVRFTQASFYTQALVGSYVLFFGWVLVGVLVMLVVPRLLGLIVRPGRVYPLYGLRYTVHRAVGRLTNLHFFTRMFGDSSYIVGYLRSLGYGLPQVQQTGSNFGTEMKHDTPYLSEVGRGTMIADGLSIINTEFSSTSFRVSQVTIGSRNFLGNKVAYPTRGRTGDNCLLATKVMVPVDGAIRENVGLLGSPSFEIPRSVERDVRLHLRDPAELRRGLDGKNSHNIVTMALYLIVRWVHFFVFTLLALIAADLYDRGGVWVIALFNVLLLLFNLVFWVTVDGSVRWLQALRPAGCSIYDRAFWRHERFWKVCEDRYLRTLNGTPFKNVVWRLLGVRIGRRVFDDGAFFPERTFVTIGDECTLNADTHIQCHSQEDGAFKSDCTTIGAGCTLGVGAFVHYGVTMGNGAELAADSFLMKGEEVPADARWGGNPAREVT